MLLLATLRYVYQLKYFNLFRQHGDALKKCEQTMKDAEFYHAEAESIRTRYNEMLIEKQRLENENNSLRLFMEEERKEMSELRR